MAGRDVQANLGSTFVWEEKEGTGPSTGYATPSTYGRPRYVEVEVSQPLSEPLGQFYV